MTDNQQRAAMVLAEIEQHVDVRQRQRILAVALDAAEARGRAEMAAKVETLVGELRDHFDHARDEAREWAGNPHRVSGWDGKASAYAWAAIRLREITAEYLDSDLSPLPPSPDVAQMRVTFDVPPRGFES